MDAQQKLQILLRSVRKEAGISQQDLAKRLNKPQSFVSKYESGERRLDILELRDICISIGLDFTTFILRLEKVLSEDYASESEI